ncbi:hypothetical protein AB205_0159800 [Aquarana catesbeiana]|uniref:Uncharacterized protein n=1 Tax=Aquarana catesbeiana TaxID=8400 RepID=A0A2G9RHJ0_AQUCT|nr:hypothetical protein AB205_0159800 [Aquarana catesbeiana]
MSPISVNDKFSIDVTGNTWKCGSTDQSRCVFDLLSCTDVIDEDPTFVLNKCLKLNAPLANISKSSVLAFEDIKALKDLMDKRSDILLK